MVADGVTLGPRALMYDDGDSQPSTVETTNRGVMLAVMTFPQVAQPPRERRKLETAAG